MKIIKNLPLFYIAYLASSLRNWTAFVLGRIFLFMKRAPVHNKKGTRVYNSWCNMKRRCRSPKCDKFKYYGGKGIDVCDEWYDSFIAFYRDMGDCPDNYQIDRIDNNKGYCKENCKWSSISDQKNNMSTNRVIEYQGERKTLSKWCDIFGLNYNTTHSRVIAGWPLEKAFNSKKYVNQFG